MTEFEVIMDANTKPARTRRKPLMDAKERFFLDKVREVKVHLLQGKSVVVVLDHARDFEHVFNHYSSAMRLYARHGNLSIKTLDEVTAKDLECSIVEMDKE